MRQLYSFLLTLLLPGLFLRLAYRSVTQDAGYRARWGERLALTPVPQVDVVVHAVSLGETIAAIGLIHAILAANPHFTVLLTTTTLTGSRQARTCTDPRVFHAYLPYDLPYLMRRFLRQTSPKAMMIMETELWPNLLATCAALSIPVVIANARLSEKSLRGYLRIRPFVAQMLSHVSVVSAQSAADGARFAALGLPVSAMQINGNLKFDLSLPDRAADPVYARLRNLFSGYAHRWIAASTHPGEETQVLIAHRMILATHPRTLLILVPRHPERASAVKAECERAGFRVALHSESGSRVHLDEDIYLVDTVGELMSCYAASDVAFVGGSLVPTGGHNILEPMALSIPTISGPHVFNFSDIVASAQEANAVETVDQPEGLATKVVSLLEPSERRSGLITQAHRLLEDNRGATARHVALLRAWVS